MAKWAWGILAVLLALILTALFMPALGYGLNSNPKAQANAMISQLKVAVQGFHTEYGLWPPADAEGRIDNRILYHLLLGDPQGALLGNPRQIVFMEFASRDLDDPVRPTMFVDPWWRQTRKNPAQNYTVQIVNDEVRVSDPGEPNGRVPNDDPAKFLRSR